MTRKRRGDGFRPELAFATLNIQNLAPRLGQVLAVFLEHRIDVLCVQECALTLDSVGGVKSRCAVLGVDAVFGEADSKGRICLVMFASRPISRADVGPVADTGLVDKHRTLAVWVPRLGQPPVLMMGIYGHANAPAARNALISAASRATCRLCRHGVLLGDFNEEASDGACGEAQANLGMRAVDELCGVPDGLERRP